MKKSIGTLAVGLSVMIAPVVNAALLEMDWNNANDGLITRDTSTNLEWLDLSLNIGRNYNSVFADLQSGGQYYGFRYATRQEYETLWAGTSFDHNNWLSSTYLGDPDEIARARLLGDLAGYTYDTTTGNCTMVGNTRCYRENMGMLADTDNNGYHWLTHMDLFDSANDSIAYVGGRSYWTTIYGNPNFLEGSNSYFDQRVSSWLVRDQSTLSPVPVPAAAWLFGSALLGFAGFSARRKKSSKT